MTQTLEALARRTSSIQGIRTVVHTMKTLAVINAAPFEDAARAIDAYHASVLEALHALLSQSAHVNTRMSAHAVSVYIVFGSDHGLCGNYNEALAAHVAKQIERGGDVLLCVGAQIADALRDQGLNVQETFFPPASVDGIGRLSNLLTKTLAKIRSEALPGNISVSLAHFARCDEGGQAPLFVPLLPLDPALITTLQTTPWASRSLPFFSLRPDDLFASLIQEHLFASLFKAAAEALVTENAARLALMQQAEQSVDDRLGQLQAETRVMRQSEITTELLDVIIGFEALKKSRKNDNKNNKNRLGEPK